VEQSSSGIDLSQLEYLKSIVQEFPKVHKRETPADPYEKFSDIDSQMADGTIFRQTCGKLRYLAVTRPDIEYALNFCARFQCNPQQQHYEALLKIVGYLKKHQERKLVLRPSKQVGEADLLRLSGYADSSYADDVATRRTTVGYVCFVNDLAVSWKSKLSPNVVQSVAHGEYIAINECALELLFIYHILESIGVGVEKPMTIYTDNDAARSMVTTCRSSEKSKAIDVRVKLVRELYHSGLLVVERVCSADNLADGFTKALGPKIFRSVFESSRCFGFSEEE
jgi:hypothetical protein